MQAAEINAEIRRLKGAYPGKPLYAVISDVCASGGYYVAVAADEIYGNRSSLVGSIGVLLDGFGFVESMKKLGIERRLLTSGENKGMLDSFSPENESHRRHAQSVLHEVHRQVIYAVKQGRGARLADNEDIFSGLFWSGEQAKQLGLIDGFGSIDDVARDAVSVDEIVNYTVEFPWFDRFAGLVGASISRALTRNNFVLRYGGACVPKKFIMSSSKPYRKTVPSYSQSSTHPADKPCFLYPVPAIPPAEPLNRFQ